MTVRGPFAVILFAVLFLSLAANLLIAGFLVGRVSGGPRPPGDIERIATAGSAGFPRPIREAIQAGTRERRGEARDLVREVERARGEMVAAMRADPYDEAAVAAAQEALRVATEKLQQFGQEIIRAVLADVPAETRAEIGERGNFFDGRPPRDRPPRDNGEDGGRFRNGPPPDRPPPPPG